MGADALAGESGPGVEACQGQRQVRWKEWKTAAAKRHNLRIRGISEGEARKWAGVSRRYWRVAGSQILQVSLPNSYWDRLGLKTLSQTWQRLNPAA